MVGSVPAAGVDNADLGSATIQYGGAGSALPESVRFFGGLQANVLVLKAYGHLNVTTNGGVGGNLGVRVAW